MSTLTYSSIYNYTATIIGYNAQTGIALLDTPVNISMGYNSQEGTITSQYNIKGTIANIPAAIAAGKPVSLSSDENGNFVGIFNVPSTTFQTGQRVFRIDNRKISTDPTTATTYSEATFTASGLQTTSQQLNFAPSVDSAAGSFTQVSQQSQKLINTITTISPYDPIAQSFIVNKDNYGNGIFLNSIKLFFNSKPTNNIPITLSIVGTLNGYPNGKILDYSTVTLFPNQVLTSNKPHYLDPTTYTEFVFEAPVYIQAGELYAFILKSSSADYYVYYAQQNQLAVPSTAKAKPTDPNPSNPTKIGAAPYVGALFESQNAITWTANQTADMMFVIDRCVFDTTQTPQIPFVVPQNLPHRKLGQDDILHKLSPNSVSNLKGNYSVNRLVDAINVSTTDFLPTGTNINYSYQATLNNGQVPTQISSITPGRLGTPTLDDVPLNDGNGERVLLKSSSNSFSLFATLQSTDPSVSPIISDDGVSLYTTKYLINNMPLSNNIISVVSGGSGYNVNTTSVIVSAPTMSGGTQASASITANATGAITSVYVTVPGSGYIQTPTITISDPTTRSGNANATIAVYGETSSKGGNSYAKYFTKTVVLTPGNDSGDLRVFYTAYKPIGSDVFVYYKILNRNDQQNFADGYWQLMTPVTNINSNSYLSTDYIEYEVAPGAFGQGANNNISYLSTNGTTYTQFSQFAIKVVLVTNDNTNPPFLTNIRALALPPGTGI
jgi:hypothetical protein